MPIYITQGRYTREAVKGTIVRPEYRADAVSRLRAKADLAPGFKSADGA
jgi:hypothetical protein